MLIFWLFTIAVVIQCAYAVGIFVRIFRISHMKALVMKRERVSVIICAKNEAENLRKNLPLILSQNYRDETGKPLYEVIVVNDNSTDDTARVLQELEQQYEHLWDVTVAAGEERILKGKRHALARGVQYASHEWLVMTDADCRPASDEWLMEMVTPLACEKEIVAGYSGYNRAPGLLNAFIRWETLHTFLQYSTYAHAGMPYMAVGRNMACTKEVFLKAQADPRWNVLPSGDDDMLVRIAGNSGNTYTVCTPPAFTRSDAKTNWTDWMRQKQRHLSTGKYYRSPVKLLLGIYGLSHAVMWLTFFALLFFGHRQVVVMMMSLRCLLYYIIWVEAACKLKERSLIYLFPLFDLGWVVYNFVFFPYIAWTNKKSWT